MGEVVQGNFGRDRDTDLMLKLGRHVIDLVELTRLKADAPRWVVAGMVIAHMTRVIYAELDDEAADKAIDIAINEWPLTEE